MLRHAQEFYIDEPLNHREYLVQPWCHHVCYWASNKSPYGKYTSDPTLVVPGYPGPV